MEKVFVKFTWFWLSLAQLLKIDNMYWKILGGLGNYFALKVEQTSIIEHHRELSKGIE